MPAHRDQSVSNLIQKLYPRGRLLRTWPLGGGISAEMTAFEVEEGGITHKYILRLPGRKTLQSKPRAAEIEFNTLQLVQTLRLPAPNPLTLDESGELIDRPYLILEYIEGQPLFSVSGRNDMLRQMASALSAIHQVELFSLDVSFLSSFTEKDCAGDQRPSDLLSAADLSRILTVMDKAPLAHNNKTVLLHCDFWPGNILWQNGKLAAVIDWEDACLGEPLIDFAGIRLDAAWIFGMNACTEFSEHYLALNPVDTNDLPFYDLCVALRLARLIGDDLEGWASFFKPYGRVDITSETIRKNFHFFVSQAIEKISG